MLKICGIDCFKEIVLGITDFHNGMILSTLSISSHGFAFGFPKKPPTIGDVFLTFELIIIL